MLFVPENVKSTVSGNLGLCSLLNIVVVDFEWKPELFVDDSLDKLSKMAFVSLLYNVVNKRSK